ncbi:zinc finger CW-type PWWP domain protein 1 [Pelobates fuscus]|uniref:zinc finger CW-type PWWP domain protein 1 n=1 Tax=Pelobates fuscus TaxID=191477 RepID=UPI002FE4F7AF
MDPSLLADDWSCKQNIDPLYNSCAISEETWLDCDHDTVYALFIPGSIVWAKQHGYPWWPAIVDYDPDIAEYFLFENSADQFPSKYHVAFLGKSVLRAWVCSSLLNPFQGTSPKGMNKKVKKNMRHKLECSIRMANEALSLGIPERIHKYGFSGRYGAKSTEDV